MEKSGRKQDAAELGGEFPIQDCQSGEGGLIQVYAFRLSYWHLFRLDTYID